MRDDDLDDCDVVRPVVIDSPKRLLLLVPRVSTTKIEWMLPVIPIRRGETTRRAAARYLRRAAHFPALRISPLIGRLPRRDPPNGTQYVVVVRPAAGGWPVSIRSALALETRWWTTDALRAERVLVDPVQLLDFMDGYWEGWLPDEEISLE
ncbi:hypothetical protein ABZX34_02320 [Streptomyces sp. NPDC004362]|uniref:hypothetical protein n=1 Tax=Streptomyces sp. NPDC004362 TaxID=3154456 RepID=UPI0033A2DB3F